MKLIGLLIMLLSILAVVEAAYSDTTRMLLYGALSVALGFIGLIFIF